MGSGVADELRFGGEPQQRLDHREGDQLRVGQLGGNPDCWALGRPFGVIDQSVIDRHVESRRERVQIRVHSKVLQDQGLLGPLIVDTLATPVVDTRAERANPLELLV
jgi:hypothetical protein